MQNTQVNSFKSNQRTHQRHQPPLSRRLHPKDAEVVEYTKISQCDPPYKKWKKKTPHDISIGAEKLFDKNPTAFHDESLRDIRDTRNTPKYNKGYIQETYSQHHARQRKTQSFPLKVRNRTRVNTGSTRIQCSV